MTYPSQSVYTEKGPEERGGGRERRGSVVRSVSLARPGPSHLSVEALHTAGACALSNGASATEPRQQSSTATACRVSPMELPLGGPALRHYTQSRPRPHRQKLNYRPSRPQETIIESEHEVLELMGRVDEGVEEFFTKRVLPTDTLKNQDEETITVHEVAPASSVPCPPQTKTLRRKLGDFFTLKKRRGLKSEPSHEGRPKKASIADFIRPLREVARAEKDKEKDRVKEHDKENEKEKAKDGESAVHETPVSGAAPLRGDAAPPRRALREGKSQSLILLSGSAAAGHTNARNTAKKQFEGQNSFEQKLHLMLQRIGVSKPPPEETQNQEGEMKKAESEGTIIDSKPEPTASFSKPRTMSASSDTRHQIRPSVSAHESAGKPALLPKPVIKPGAPPTTSGRNTPENELAQIQEGETNTPTKVSPTAAPSPPPAPTATTIPTVPTMSDSIPDSISPSSTVTPSDTDICTDSVNTTAAATMPTNATELDSTASEGSAATTTLPTTTTPTTLTSTTTPTDPPATVSVISTSSVPIPPSPSVTSDLTTTTTPSITTIESVSAPISESSVSTASLNLSPISTLPELNGILSVDASPGDAPISVYTTAASPSTSTSTAPSCLSTTINSFTEASDDSTLVASPCCVTLLSPVAENSSPTSNSYDAIPATVSPDAPVATSSTLIAAAPPPPSSTTNRSPTPTDCINSIPASTVTHPVIPSPTDICVPSTSCVETTPTDTTSTTTTLNHAETTPTSSSATTAGVSSTLATDSDPDYFNNATTTLTIPTTPTIFVSDSSSATSQHLTSPAHSNDRPGQDKDLQTSPEEQPSAEPAEKSTDEELEMVQKSKQTEMDEEKGVVDDEKRHEKPTLVSSEETRKEVQEESEKAEEDAVAEPLSGREGEWCEVSDEVEVKEGEVEEGVVEGPKQEETKSTSEK
ncbi:mucin-5AC-like [Hippoglossus hippoglossus]|uniref:mucin-5AC-like n=1 Tax=Hippoglossus hippoglossus TaxID=8267 RepID=UPI00148C1715|nr:mucin-5AC-like [Hippoglossus hippoglossus]